MQGNFNFIQNFQVNWHKLRIPVFLWSDLASPLFFLQGQCLEIVDPPPVISWFLPIWAPYSYAKVILHIGFDFAKIFACAVTPRSHNTPESSSLVSLTPQESSSAMSYWWSYRICIMSEMLNVQEGAPLMEVVDMGCERLTFAADAMNILIRYVS